MDKETYERWWAARYRHGGYTGGKETPEHYTWRTMVARCCKPKARSYSYYGGRGISICDRWLDYGNFIADMGVRPTPEHSLDRVDNNGPYSPDNCRWATRSEQQKNKSSTRWYTNGKFTGTLVESATHVGISKALAHYRWKQWGTFERGVEWRLLPRVV